ncbi:MAG: CoA-transferase [Desulfurococcales archaeon]|nr:CoA-transferase [Desulfurococcales archaeon]
MIRCLEIFETKLVSAWEALSCIEDGQVIAISGFNMATTPEHLILELFNLYKKTGHPKSLFIISDALPAVPGRALDKVAEELYREGDRDFIRGVLMPYLGFSPWLQRMIMEDMIEAYSWPLGITAYWFREIASGRPGLITRIGLDTFLDPRQDGGAMNNAARRAMTCRVELIKIGDDEYLFYRAPKPRVALIRGTTADSMGNLSLEDEGIRGTVLNIAQASKARPDPGVVIAQVRWVTEKGTLKPREVEVPGPLIDYIVKAPRERHWQSGSFEYDPRACQRVIPPMKPEILEDLPMQEWEDYEYVIARRALMELIRIVESKRAPALVNIGVGIPALITRIAVEEGISSYIIPVVESGPWGGLALPGQDFGIAFSPFALTSIPDTFSIFEGGVIDVAVLGFLQIDSEGNVNPSALPDRIPGPGGFPVIAGGAPKNIFAGSFTAGSRDIRVSEKGLEIRKDGDINKFVVRVYKVFFSGKTALKYGKEVTYITERAVFRLTEKGLEIVEIAPGVDLEKHILSRMEFKPLISRKLETMDHRLFRVGKTGFAEEIRKIMRA